MLAATTTTTSTQRTVDAFARVYTPLVVASTGVLAFGVPAFLALGESDADVRAALFAAWLERALVVLVAACPCALVLASPLATSCALAKAAEGGMIVKHVETLEKLPQVTFAALDKTGTLTKGKFRVVAQRRFARDGAALPDGIGEPPRGDGGPALSLDDVRTLAASVEALSSHPLATAVVEVRDDVSHTELVS